MSIINNDPKTLQKLTELREEVRNNFLVEKLQNQGMSESLKKIYKPLIQSNEQTKKELIKQLGDMSNKYNTNWLEFKTMFGNFPDLVRNVDEIKHTLDIKATELIHEIKSTNELNKGILDRIENLNTSFQDLDRIFTKPEEYPKMFEEGTSGVGTMVPEETATQKEKVEKYFETIEDIRPENLVQYLRGISNYKDKEKESRFKEILSNDEHRQELVNHVIVAQSRFNEHPWTDIRKYDPDFYAELEGKKMKPKKIGKGIRSESSAPKVLLPSNNQDLVVELKRLYGSYKSGNASVYNELEAVVDQLRRNGVITLNVAKKIYKDIK